MNKAHRDRIAFIRIVSGEFDAGMEAWHVQSNKKVKLSQPTQIMASERQIVDKAYAGDIIGIFDPGTFAIGDTPVSYTHLAKVIIAVTISGNTASRMSKYLPSVPIIGSTNNLKVYHQMALYRGVQPMLRESRDNMEDIFEHCVLRATEEGYVEKGDRIVLSAGVPIGENRTNTIRVWNVE